MTEMPTSASDAQAIQAAEMLLAQPPTGSPAERAVRIVYAALNTAQDDAFAGGDDELGEALGELAAELEELTGVEP